MSFRESWARFRALWKPMAAWTGLVWAVELAVLAPVSGFVLGRLLIRGERVAISNVELLSWVASPWGAVYILVAGGLALLASGLRFAGLFDIASDHRRGRAVSVRRTAFHALLQLPRVLKLGVVVTGAAVVAVLPLAGGMALIRGLFLAPHDLIYYMETAPPEWKRAVAAGVVWGAVWLAAVLFLGLRLVLAVPAYLEGRSLRESVAASWRTTAGRRVQVLRLLGLSALGFVVARAAVDLAVFQAAGLIVRGLGLPLQGMIYASALFVVTAFVFDAIVSFVGFSLISLILADLHDRSGARFRAPRPSPVRAARTIKPWLRPGRAILGLVVLLAAGAAVAVVQVQNAPLEIETVISAHRGAGWLAPENSLAAIDKSIALGADYVEIDVQKTRDGVLVAFHDADLMRIAQDPRHIGETLFEDLAGVDIGAGMGPEFAGERIPTLGQCLDRARGRIGVMIELKVFGFDPSLAKDCLEAVRARGMEREVVLMSLHPRAVRELQALGPGPRVGYLSILSAGDLGRLDVDLVGVPRRRATPAFLREARRRGMSVYVWGVNRPGDMADLMERGAAGLITDDPGAAIRVREMLRGLSPAEILLLRFRKVWDLDEEENKEAP